MMELPHFRQRGVIAEGAVGSPVRTMIHPPLPPGPSPVSTPITARAGPAESVLSEADGILCGMSTRTVSPVLVGRTGELNRLEDAFAASPGAVLIGGEAGVGKTRLIREFTARVAGRARVLTGGCLELGADGLPFAPFTTVLRGLVRELGIDGARRSGR
jgi:AAA ATPase domain